MLIWKLLRVDSVGMRVDMFQNGVQTVPGPL